MDSEPELEFSDSSGEYTSDGKTVEVHIYRLVGEASWALEVVDEYNNSTVWDGTFTSGAEARAELEKTIQTEGIDCLIGKPGSSSN